MKDNPNKAADKGRASTPCSRLARYKREWRIIPTVKLVNFQKMFPNSRCWSRWIYVDRKWSGKIIHVGIRQWCLILDFRKAWLADFLGENAKCAGTDASEKTL